MGLVNEVLLGSPPGSANEPSFGHHDAAASLAILIMLFDVAAIQITMRHIMVRSTVAVIIPDLQGGSWLCIEPKRRYCCQTS
jgi:hypothetical protein